MRRRRQEPTLDFSPLLDVVLIMLFFFILFGQLETEENKTAAEAQMLEAQAMMDQADAKEAAADTKMREAESLASQLEDELDLIRQFDPQVAENLEALLEFSRGRNIKMLLKMEESSWTLKVFSGDVLLSAIEAGSDVSISIVEALLNAGYSDCDTIFCEFILDGSQAGTASAYRTITQAIKVVRGTYPNFYYSETDISIMEG